MAGICEGPAVRSPQHGPPGDHHDRYSIALDNTAGFMLETPSTRFLGGNMRLFVLARRAHQILHSYCSKRVVVLRVWQPPSDADAQFYVRSARCGASARHLTLACPDSNLVTSEGRSWTNRLPQDSVGASFV